MREIKFRMYVSITGKMYYGVELTKKADGWWWMCEAGAINANSEVKSTRQVLMQYTGLKDRKGKEIYEGDYLAVWEDEQWCIRGVVSFDDLARYYLAWNDGNASDYDEAFETDDWKNLEVIGNIYENSGLLKT